MTDLNSPKEFAEACKQIDDPEQIRNAMHEPEPESAPSKHRYEIVGGRMIKVESGYEQS